MTDLLSDSNVKVAKSKQHEELSAEIRELKNTVWVEKWRPRKIDDIILPEEIKTAVKYAMEKDNFQHMIFHSGKPGTGKTTLAKIIPEEYGAEYMFIKTATEARLSTVEDDIPIYGRQKLGDDKPRFVIMDEADRVRGNVESFYTALQPIIESTRTTLRFILTVNHLHRIPEAIRESRCEPISFAHNDQTIKKPMFKRLVEIAETEVAASGGKVDVETIRQIARLKYPDMRAMINAMQNTFNANKGSIIGNFTNVTEDHIKVIWELIREGKILPLRKYFTEYITDVDGFYVPFLNYALDKTEIENKYLLDISCIVAEHQFRASFDRVDPEVNIRGAFAEIIQVMNG